MNPFTIRSAGFGVLSLLVGAIGTIALARYESAVRASIAYHHLRRDYSWARNWFAEWRFTNDGDVHSIRSMSDQGWGEGPDGLPISVSTLPAWSRISQTRGDDPHCSATLIEIPYGWPMRSMVSEFYEPGINGFSGYQGGSNAVSGTPMARGWFAMPWWTDGFMDRTKSLDQWLGGTVRYNHFYDTPRFFPTRIVPLGFIVNSLCYAASFWLAVTMLRTAFHIESRAIRLRIGNWRARRGQCRACGYALAANVLCPECGEQVRA